MPVNKADDKVSVIMPNYNYAGYIGEAIDSVVNQTYKNWELIIVDDGSNDGSLEIIKRYTDRFNNIKLYTHQNHANQGLSATYVLALSKATGKYVSFLESDDAWGKRSLELKVRSFERYPEAALVYSDLQIIAEGISANVKEGYIKRCRDIGTRQKRPFEAVGYLLERNIIPTFSVAMTKRSMLKDVDFSARGHQAWLDWWVWGQLAAKGKFLFVPEKATRWRLHPDSNNQRFVDSVNRRKYFVLFRRDLLKLLLENIRQIRGIRNKLRLISTALGNHIDYLRIESFD